MYEIFFSDEAKKKLAQLDTGISARIGAAIERIKIRPHNFVKRIYNCKYYRLRVDDYRIILDIQDLQLIIYIIEIGRREDIYKTSFN